MTVLEGTLCAPMALRTIWSTVEIFTNAVTLMNANGKSDTIASATTSTTGRARRSSALTRPPRRDHGRAARAISLARDAPNAGVRGARHAGARAAGISPSFVNPAFADARRRTPARRP